MGWKRSLPVFVLAVALAFSPLAAAAQVGVPAPEGEGSGTPADSAPATSETWAGGLASIGCGIFVRATIVTAGTQVGTIVGAVACCGYMLFDAFVMEGQRG